MGAGLVAYVPGELRGSVISSLSIGLGESCESRGFTGCRDSARGSDVIDLCLDGTNLQGISILALALAQ